MKISVSPVTKRVHLNQLAIEKQYLQHYFPIICSVIFTTACGDGSSSANNSASYSQGLPSIPSLAGQCDAILQGTPDNGPGIVILAARQGELICASARGMADIEFGLAADSLQKFRIGSITKQFTAVALLKLVDQGKAMLEDPLSMYVSGFPNGEQITLLHLLNHTSGVGELFDVPNFYDTTLRLDTSTQELVTLIGALPVNFAPGTSWRYSNSGYILLSAVIQNITGKSWHKAFEELLFVPLNLRQTSWENPDQLWPTLVRGYTKNSQGSIAPADPISMTVPHGAGALISTARDLWSWNEALHGGRILSVRSYQQMTRPQGAAVGNHAGFGINTLEVRGHASLWHNGEINGFVADLIYIPDSGTTVVQLNNTDRPDKRYFLQLAAQLIGDPYEMLTTHENWSLQQLQGVEGVYSKDGVTRTIQLRDGKFYSQVQGGQSLELFTSTQDRLGFNVDSLTWIELIRDFQGAVTSLKYHSPFNSVDAIWLRR